MRIARLATAAAAAGLLLFCLGTERAEAQGFDAQLFRPAMSTSAYFSQERARVLGRAEINAGLTLDYARNPLVLRDADTNQIVDGGSVVANRLAADVGIALGIADFLELRARVPIVLVQTGELDLIRAQGSLKATALGDFEVSAKAGLVGGPADVGFHLAVALGLTVPSGSTSGFAGDGGVGARPRLIIGYEAARFSLAANAGYNLRHKNSLPSGSLTVDDELAGGLGAAYAVAPDSLWVVGEAYLARGVHAEGAGIRDTPSEALAGARYALPGPWMLQGGVGFGLTSGVGAPTVRAFLTLAYATDMHHPPPAPRPLVAAEENPPPAPAAPRDSDGDGILDKDDKCPNEPEDKDGFQDDDGCPDPDNDADGILDKDDKCPNEPEVFNGIDDDDGCPDKGAVLAVMTGERIEIREQVNFATNKAIIQRSSFPLLSTIAKLLALHPEVTRLRVEGHTDRSGVASKNQKLSQARAEAVRRYLIDAGGIDGARLEAAGFGSSRPIASNATKKGRALNRRSEFIIVDRAPADAPASR
ncbi:MAG TPA: OmpA family protein [Polyangia bacterium]|nr:OmpA family protein [Polyangia bacterium]